MVKNDANVFELVGQQLDMLREDAQLRLGADYLFLPDPPGKSLLERYAQRYPAGGPELPVLYAAVLPSPARQDKYVIAPVLLEALGDPSSHKQEHIVTKTFRLVQYMQERRVQLCILADFHHLLMSGSRIRANELGWVLGLFHGDLHDQISVAITGQLSEVETLLHSDEQLDALFGRMPLSEDEAGHTFS